MSYSDIPTSQHSFSIMVKTSYKLYSQLVGSLLVVGSKPSILTNFCPISFGKLTLNLIIHEFTYLNRLSNKADKIFLHEILFYNKLTPIIYFCGESILFCLEIQIGLHVYSWISVHSKQYSNLDMAAWISFLWQMNCIKLDIDFLVNRKDRSLKQNNLMVFFWP